MVVEITVKNKEGNPVLTQAYELPGNRASFDIRPLSASGLREADLGFTLKDDQTWTWRLVIALKWEP